MTPTKSSRALLLLLSAWLITTGCINPVNEGERPCPCAAGWTCCPEEQVCVADATRCRLPKPPTASAPSAPRAVEVTPAVRAATLGWSAPEHDGGGPITGYQVDVDPIEVGMVVAVDGLTAEVTGLRAGATYRFTVAARNVAGVGASVSVASVRLPDVPSAPVGLAVERGDGQVRVTWQRPPSDGGLPITGYVVTAHPRGVSVAADGVEATAVVPELVNGEATTVTVRALNAVGAGPESAPSAPVVPARRPGPPASAAAAPGVRSMSVSWKAPDDSGGLPITGYVVTASPGGARQEVDGATTSAAFTSLDDDTAYTFDVVAVNALGESAAAAAAGLTPGLPGAPRDVEATPGVRSLTVKWSPPALDGRVPLTGFTVTAQPSGVSVDVGPDAREATLEDIPSTKAQTLTLTARNAVGVGPVLPAGTVRARPAPVEVTRLELIPEEGGCRHLSYDLRQPDGEHANILVEVDTDGDGFFTRATQAGATMFSGLLRLTTSAQGIQHIFRWNRARDVPGATEAARVRLTATVPGTVPSMRTLTVALPATPRRCEVDYDSSRVQWVPEDSSRTAYDMTSGDFTGDGKPDLMVSHSGSPGISLLKGMGNGGFDRPVTSHTTLTGQKLSSGDLNQDGVLDLVAVDVVQGTGLYLHAALGVYGGLLQAPMTTPLRSGGFSYRSTTPLVRDLDGDGAPEVVVAQDSELYVLRHTAHGAFTEVGRYFAAAGGQALGGDFDQDGLRDVLVVGRSLQAFYGRGLLAFTPVWLGDMAGLMESVISAVSADFNGDGAPDIAATVTTDLEVRIEVRLNDGTGRFGTSQVVHRYDRQGWDESRNQLTTADLDGNGTQDLIHVNWWRDVVSLLLGQGDGTFTVQERPCGRYQERVVAADFDGSGEADLGLLSVESRSVRVLQNFERPHRIEAGDEFLTADFDGDGWDDVASVVGDSGVQVHLTRATGGMVRKGPFLAPRGMLDIVAGRFDAGPTVDLLVLTLTQSLTLLRGNGDGTFAPGESLVSGFRPIKMAAGDIDGDGDLDVVFTDRRPDSGEVPSYDVRLLRGAGDGTFTVGAVLATHSAVQALAMGDMSKDGRADLLVLRRVHPAFELGIYHGRADGTLAKERDYSPFGVTCSASELLVHDLNADGHMDVFVSCERVTTGTGAVGGVLPLWGMDGPWFNPRVFQPMGAGARGLAARDIDGDGRQDLLVTSQSGDALCAFTSEEFGDFQERACFEALPQANIVLPLDLEHDGITELLVGGASPHATLLRPR
ncbi:hypothetical protein HPC49_07825 [Pyxidicoccus fallax]|uniref:Fibronectin type-III domain-containing protein n=1 Tax=Pyxidicoccus fallax TaxID=394095 RepID=A0A848LCF7_9BACT|nr:FG-GAP-like repeat-containing protein [Pyxidicoccus fallax]NMO16357.1 hypothetical protein [Pyxidicoccus fallax]NPC78161.1 hypothetical protein [Pyxidicoccus fallax]